MTNRQINLSSLLLGICILLCSCQQPIKQENTSQDTKDSVGPQFTKIQKDSLFYLALEKGNRAAYGTISAFLYLAEDPYKYYYNSLLMANKHQDSLAYFDLYSMSEARLTYDKIRMYSEDSLTKAFAIYYLLKSNELGYKQANEEVKRLFKNSPPKSSYYLTEKLKNF